MIVMGRMKLIFGLVLLTYSASGLITSTTQRYDGWFNNLVHPDWGSVEQQYIRKTPVSYDDEVYLMHAKDRPNPRLVSELLFKGPDGYPSALNRTTMLAFFGQIVAYEILLGTEMSCPIEMMPVDMMFCSKNGDCEDKDHAMPFHRAKYMKGTGESVNNPRTQINLVTSWIDGSFVYSTLESWVAALRSFQNGTLLATMEGKYPAYNDIGLPMYTHYAPHLGSTVPITSTYRLGDPRANQHPALLALSILFFRYHNVQAARIGREQPHLSDDEIFSKARRWVIATLQNIIMYEYVPALLDEPTEDYEGYDPDVHPGISDLFLAAAFRFSHTIIPAGFYLRDEECRFRTTANGNPGVRLCNSYKDGQATIKMYGLEEILMGMASQIAEKEDHILIEDLRDFVFGPKMYSRRDLAALNIMRGRDYGIADYNTVRKSFMLPEITDWTQINPQLNATSPKLFEHLKQLYKNPDRLDLWVGGMMESTGSGPGPVFHAIIKDQFLRIRNGDRFWFENRENRLFTEEEILQIRNTTLRDIILAATNIKDHGLQDNVFFWHEGNKKGCSQPKQLVGADMEPCTPLTRYDHFTGSDFFYVFSCIVLAVVPIVLALAAYFVVKQKMKKLARIKKKMKEIKKKPVAKDTSNENQLRIKATEWLNIYSNRKVVVQFGPAEDILLLSRKHDQLRRINMSDVYNVVIESNLDVEGDVLALVRVPKDHDLVLLFSSSNKRKDFLSIMKDFLQRRGKSMEVLGTSSTKIHESAETKEKRVRRLETFFREAYKEVFEIPTATKTQKSRDPAAADELLNTELTRSEFAEALGMASNSLFVDRMFAVADVDKNGYISYQDFLDTARLFTKGSKNDKMRILYDILNVSQEEHLSVKDFENMIRSLIQTTQSDFDEEQTHDLLSMMLRSTNLGNKKQLSYEEFRTLLEKHERELEKIGLHLKGTKQIYVQKRSNLRTQSFRVETDVFQIPLDEPWIRQKWNSFITYLEDNRQHVFYLTLFYLICAFLFIERYTHYCIFSEHKDLRKVMGNGICVTRGAAGVICFTYALIVLTVCRHIITYLRDTVINQYVPLDSAIMFHKICACTAGFFTAVHTVGHVINFYHVSTQPVEHLHCLFKGIVFESGFQPTFQYFLYATIPGITGLLLVIMCYSLYIFATPVVRLRAFATFWTTHHLYIPIYILTVIHGSARLSGPSVFWTYTAGPIALFAIDKLIVVRNRKLELAVVGAELLPSDVTKVVFSRPPSFLYRSGQWVRLCCPAVSPGEYHALTLTSAPHEHTLCVHVKAYGRWTWTLRNILDPANMIGFPYPTVQVDGPYGGGNQEWYKYEIAVMIGGGIGITPYASILSDLVYGTSTNRYRGVYCKKVYFLWVCPTHRSWEWFVDVLRNAEERDVMGVIDVHIFVTQYFDTFDLRTMMLYICEKHFQKYFKRSIFTGLRAKNHFGRPDFQQIFRYVRSKHPRMSKVGVFSCGPPALTNSIGDACAAVNQTRQLPNFLHFYENF